MKEFNIMMPHLAQNNTFNVDWRMTSNPDIHDNLLDLGLYFDIGPDQSRCLEDDFTHDYYFLDQYEDKYLQFIVSDRVPNCMLAAMERQQFFKLDLSSEHLRTFFGTGSVKINAELLEEAYPAIRERYGRYQELEFEIEFKNPRVAFGTTDSNVAFTSSILFGIKIAGSMNYLIYDELDFATEFDFSIEQETLFGAVKKMTWSKSGDDVTRSLPVFNDIGLTKAEYQQYWDWLEEKSDSFYQVMNNMILEQGIQLPYWNLSYLTKFTFHKHAMIAVVDLYYNISEK